MTHRLGSGSAWCLCLGDAGCACDCQDVVGWPHAVTLAGGRFVAGRLPSAGRENTGCYGVADRVVGRGVGAADISARQGKLQRYNVTFI